MLESQLARLDEGRVNERILAKAAKEDFRRVEEAGIPTAVHLSSPEAKRLFTRCFMSFQLNVHFILNVARMKLSADDIEKVEEDIRAQLQKGKLEFNKAIDAAEVLFEKNAVKKQATYQTVPLEMEVYVHSALANRYYELIVKLDQLMPILKTLEIEDIRSSRQVDKERARYKRVIVNLQASTRRFATGLRRRIHAEQLLAFGGVDQNGADLGGRPESLQDSSETAAEPQLSEAGLDTQVSGLSEVFAEALVDEQESDVHAQAPHPAVETQE